ncbi:uncharacterized protein FTJAE_1524 [Fusarium tjaetaba]|uniref:DUF7708 domain-containing protein n=1 Tax=Fusarium tjaetaba TaxID=1567544 RepID=A0A8H5SC51_9HYPO|nr:uncharacterized protein FTJAE_1524 [Fusarium tjaetaba]KAF5647841.1 hypothetical protein FTJAE_1524 [Fusarium tjaetaba]
MQDLHRELFLSARDRLPSNEAARYIENNIALPEQPLPVFSERLNGFVSLDEARQEQEESATKWKEIQEETESLFAVMAQVQKKLGQDKTGQKYNTKVDLRQCNWKVVMGEVEKTAQLWRSRPNKQSKVMVFVDKVGRHSEALERWLGLLPTGDYGSSICGAFKIIIGAAGRYTKVEESVYEAISEIPMIMERAKRYVDMYRQMRDQFLEQRTIELFRAILTLLHQVMQFFLDGKPKKFIGSLIQQGSYKEQLFQSVEAIKACAQAVNDEASQCQARMVMKVYGKTEQTQIVFHRLMEFLLTNARFQAAESGISPRNSAPGSDPSRLQVSSYDILNADRFSLWDQDISQSTTPTILQSPSQQPTQSKADMEQTKQRLLRCLNYNPEALTRDILSILSLNYQTSTRLLANGRGDLSARGCISRFSVVMAELARMSNTGLTGSAPVLILEYFCSEHQPSHPNDPLASAVGMMASILGQLIRQMTDKGLAVDLSFISDSKWRKLERLELHTLYKVFKRVVDQIPQGGVVLCIIDEISVYETSRLGEETEMAVKKLVQLPHQGRYPVFKLLVTCYVHALDVGRYFSVYTLDLKKDIEADDTADWVIANQLS